MEQLRVLKNLLEESKKPESELNSFEIQAIEWAILVIESQIGVAPEHATDRHMNWMS